MAVNNTFKVFAVNQSLGFVLGWLFHGVVSHLFTGEHEFHLSVPQLIMHNVSLIGMAMIVLYFQDRATRQLWGLGLMKYWLLYLVVPIGVFWLGYYCIGMPMDLVLAFLGFATLNGILMKKQLRAKWWVLLSILSAITGLVVGTVIVTPLEPILIEGLTGAVKHIVVFALEGSAIGIPMAIAGGLMLRRAVAK